MNRDEFFNKLIDETGLTREQAEDAVEVILDVFTHKITKDESDHAKAQLSEDLKELWDNKTFVNKLKNIFNESQYHFKSKEEFLDLVKEKFEEKGIDMDPNQIVISCLRLFRNELSDGEIEDIKAQLPQQIKEIWMTP